jgi:hypothetical protein
VLKNPNSLLIKIKKLNFLFSFNEIPPTFTLPLEGEGRVGGILGEV